MPNLFGNERSSKEDAVSQSHEEENLGNAMVEEGENPEMPQEPPKESWFANWFAKNKKHFHLLKESWCKTKDFISEWKWWIVGAVIVSVLTFLFWETLLSFMGPVESFLSKIWSGITANIFLSLIITVGVVLFLVSFRFSEKKITRVVSFFVILALGILVFFFGPSASIGFGYEKSGKTTEQDNKKVSIPTATDSFLVIQKLTQKVESYKKEVDMLKKQNISLKERIDEAGRGTKGNVPSVRGVQKVVPDPQDRAEIERLKKEVHTLHSEKAALKEKNKDLEKSISDLLTRLRDKKEEKVGTLYIPPINARKYKKGI